MVAATRIISHCLPELIKNRLIVIPHVCIEAVKLCTNGYIHEDLVRLELVEGRMPSVERESDIKELLLHRTPKRCITR